MDLHAIQESIKKYNGDGWLFYDFRGSDKVAYEILDLDGNVYYTRRWFYFIPCEGEPVKIIHRIEQDRFSSLSGIEHVYSSWEELYKLLRETLKGVKKVFMQYSPNNNIPTVSIVDAGTMDVIRSFDIEVLSSVTLVQLFKSILNEKGIESHKTAADKIYKIKDNAFKLISDYIKRDKAITEYDIQQYIINCFKEENLTCGYELPIVAVNDHAANPHFQNNLDNNYEIKIGDRVLIDLWAKVNTRRGIYCDITWCGFVGDEPHQEYIELFNIVVEARDVAKNFIKERIENNQVVFGWEVDKACRDFITQKGYGDYFIHRTGHSIDTSDHGSGVNLDNFETKDDRQLLPGSCFSIEPGIYKDDIGVRTEINVIIGFNNNIIIEGLEQSELVILK